MLGALEPEWMVQWIKNPQAFDPATLMPNLGVQDAEAIAPVAIWQVSRRRRRLALASWRPSSSRQASEGARAP